MAKPNLIVLYVADPLASVEFYRKLLGKEPTVAFPSFSSFEVQEGFVLGLWANAGVKPGPVGEGSRAELAFMVEGEEAVRAHYEEWQAMGLPIAQELTRMDFGPTFVALDPDGHRLRVCLYDN
ncbi:VOC family protein [Sinorhizobium americanum]|uniref:Catechol 2,3-dioxygenase-like lactoylglutathione lyase family enzyme n=1 Tax=Sinorhizobium americanum TaxID=194963 RepID=A0A1L3LHC2_9HYPH|nr:VOC family protein [Sinorhizobium americanum]APG89477.1 glyoxalase/bleomycin resistance protein/dioxygenase [Sinorhizobium americanum]OAP36175.1 glyoxalase [Sinorhizobium americanum]TCN24746.1 catechol 2,3-dioxygenase-like lactoylglutathione lyase family enzyme [Sinorhizobium americanum]